MQDFFRNIKDTAQDFISHHSGFISGFAIALLSTVVRFAHDHERLEPFTKQSIYDFCRTYLMAQIVVFIVYAFDEAVCTSGIPPVVVTIGGAIYADEIISAGKNVIKGLVEAFGKKGMK